MTTSDHDDGGHIDAADLKEALRNLEITHRGPDAAVDELRNCITDFGACLKELAEMYPGAMAVGTISSGQAWGPLVITAADSTWHMSPVALQRVQMLAKLIAHLPQDLPVGFKSAFELELIAIELARIQAIRGETEIKFSAGETGDAEI
jgi:hypothetical protein